MDKFAFAKQMVALACLNAIALVYDGQYLPIALGIDALVLGYDLKALAK